MTGLRRLLGVDDRPSRQTKLPSRPRSWMLATGNGGAAIIGIHKRTGTGGPIAGGASDRAGAPMRGAEP